MKMQKPMLQWNISLIYCEFEVHFFWFYPEKGMTWLCFDVDFAVFNTPKRLACELIHYHHIGVIHSLGGWIYEKKSPVIELTWDGQDVIG